MNPISGRCAVLVEVWLSEDVAGVVVEFACDGHGAVGADSGAQVLDCGEAAGGLHGEGQIHCSVRCSDLRWCVPIHAVLDDLGYEGESDTITAAFNRPKDGELTLQSPGRNPFTLATFVHRTATLS